MVIERLPIIGVMGSGTRAYPERSVPLGERLAREGVHLLTGGGAGVMSAVSEAFAGCSDRRGLVVGVLPAASEDDPTAARPGYPNPWVELPIYTHLALSGSQGLAGRSRNHINVLSSSALVALPGGPGTASEVTLARRYGRPIVAHLKSREEIPGLPAEVQVEGTLEGVVEFLRTRLGL